MGLFSSTSNKYSQEQHRFSSKDFKKIFIDLNIKSLTKEEEAVVYDELEKHRSDDGKLSLRNVYDVVHGLKNKNKISINDEKVLMNTFKNYFAKFSK